jgi:polar amino acid transport system substrate-binding protein
MCGVHQQVDRPVPETGSTLLYQPERATCSDDAGRPLQVMQRPSRRLVIVAVLAIEVACSLPRDADGTLERVAGKPLRVGVIVEPPWVTDTEGVIGGVEATLAHMIASDVGAREVTWVRAPEHALMEALHERRLDLVIGGLTADSPWSDQVALTRPYAEVNGKPHVLAAPPGENAWLVRIERLIERQRGPLAAQVASSAR